MNIWDPFFHQRSPIFDIFSVLPLDFKDHHHWPNIDDYNELLKNVQTKIQSKSNKDLIFIEQLSELKSFEDQYEPRIYLRGEVQTRTYNWHDFFNMLIWLTFPHIKSIINARHYMALKSRLNTSKNRTSIENVLALLDENGVIIVSSDSELLEMIKDLKWKHLFWNRREEVNQKLRCYVFGHSLHEKALNPYIGMTGHAILLLQEDAFLHKPLSEQLHIIDLNISQMLNDDLMISRNTLHPIPILGMPGWYPLNDDESFYDNTDYFRQTRRLIKN